MDLSTQDIQQIIDRLVYQGLVYKKTLRYQNQSIEHDIMSDGSEEQVIGIDEEYGVLHVYCASRDSRSAPLSGLTQAPCGKCPVFDFCSDSGPVNPLNCEYCEEWLVEI